jgi:tRNA threonylcarbamoyladenosine biosynthesis protein TsaB
MNLLAFDTSTEVLSVALQHRANAILTYNGEGGARASSTLLPVIQQCMEEAGLGFSALDAIVFGQGPGAFTGLRTACAVAQGLAFAARIPALPIPTLMAVAEAARHQFGCTRVVAALDARMGEIYACPYEWDGRQWQGTQTARLYRTEELMLDEGWTLAGNAHISYAEQLAHVVEHHGCVQAQPEAAAMLRLAPGLLAKGMAVDAIHAHPLYIRDKVAQTSAERQATPKKATP